MKRLLLLALLAALAWPASAMAEDYVITLKDHQFSPPELSVPAGQKVKLTVKNEQTTPAEFESDGLHREKVVPAGGQISVLIGPLGRGRYDYFDDFHEESKGTIIAQ